MFLIFRLPLLIAEAVLRRGLGVLDTLLGLVRGDGADEWVVAEPEARSAAERVAAQPGAPRSGAAGPVGAEPAAQRSAARRPPAAGARGAAAPTPAPTPTPTPTPTPASPPPPTADEAIARRRARDAATPPPAVEPLPPRADPAGGGHVDREAVVVESLGPADSPGAALQVDEPWAGYDGMPATAVVQRLRGSDDATKAVVLLYEQRHKARRTVLAATAA